MKNLSLILNVVLIIAVGALYYMQFSSCSKAENTENTENTGTENSKFNADIAYVDFDTLINNYDMYYDLQAEMIEQQKRAEAELNSKTKKLEKQAMDFQNKVQKGLVTRSQAQEMQQQLYNEEQKLYQVRENLRIKLAEKEQVMLRTIQNSIEEYLKEYNKENNLSYVLSKTFGGQVLYSNKDLNITHQVVKGLNEKYISTKETK